MVWIALIQLTTRFAVDVLKPVFDRLRPQEAITDGLLHDRFFAGARQLVSLGTCRSFRGFFFALALLFPKWWLRLLSCLASSPPRVIADGHT